MGKRLTYSDRKKMLEVRDQGLTDAEIKARFGFIDSRTLKRHLRLAEQEQEARVAKIEIIKDALAGHLAEVRNLTEQLQGVVTVPHVYEASHDVFSQIMRIEVHPLFDALKEHVPSSILWRSYANWRSSLKTYTDDCERLKREIEKETEKWEKVRRLTETFSEPILKRLHERIVGHEPNTYAHKFEKRTEYINVGGKPIAEFEILVVDESKTVEANDALAYRAQYQALSDQVVNSEESSNVINLYNSLIALRLRIKEVLQQVLLRRDYIMQTCNLCPGQVKLIR